MSGADNVIYNVRERPLSTDWNNTEALLTRTLMDLERYRNESRAVADPATEAVRNVVLGGLLVTPNGSDVSVSTGALMQDSASLSPTPDTYDSTYRIGFLRSAETVVMPAPGGTTYYLIEAQMVAEILLAESRDILDAGTGTFVPTLIDKIQIHSLQFQLLTGGASAPAPSGGNWVPIAIVRRPGGGGAVVASDIIDVRPLQDAGRQRPPLPVNQKVSLEVAAGGAATTSAKIRCQVDGAFGYRCYANVLAATDLDSATIVSPATVYAAGTKYYLYLAPWSALSLNPRYNDGLGIGYEGVLVMSAIAPSAATKRNSAAIQLPAPFAVVDAPTSSAYYLGTFLRDAGNTGWVGMSNVDGEVRLEFAAMVASPYQTFLNPPVAGDQAFGTFATATPATAKIVRVKVLYEGAAGAPANITIALQYSGLAINLDALRVNDDEESYLEWEIPYDGSSTVQINVVGAPDAATDLFAGVIGWRE